MFGSLFFALAGVSSAYAATFNVSVGANGQLAYDPPFIMNAAVGDVVTFTFNPKNHTVTQSSFDAPCTSLGLADSGFNPVAANTTDPLPTFQFTVPDNGMQPLWFHCKQPVGNHCGHGMVFAINPPTTGHTFEAFQANANATLNATTTTAPPVISTPPPQPWTSATATVTNGTSVWTTVYSSYQGAPPPSVAPVPVTHTISVGPSGVFAYSPPNITAAVGDSVLFRFNPKNHTVTQSNFNDPCKSLEQSTGKVGFDSGFMPVSANQTDLPEFQILINDTAPIWGYCRQTGHCAAGMVFAINADENTQWNFETFQALAKSTANTTGTSPAPPAGTGANSALSSSQHAPLLTFGLVFLIALVL